MSDRNDSVSCSILLITLIIKDSKKLSALDFVWREGKNYEVSDFVIISSL